MMSTESDLRALLDRYVEAIRDKDIDRLMSLYSPDCIYFDLVAPLRFIGEADIRRNFLRWFGSWQSAINLEMRDLHIVSSSDVATAFWLHRTSGTLKDGHSVDYWVRGTICCERAEQRWLIKHEHISVPVDLKSGRVVTGLVP